MLRGEARCIRDGCSAIEGDPPHATACHIDIDINEYVCEC
jgi:hypothetical protein